MPGSASLPNDLDIRLGSIFGLLSVVVRCPSGDSADELWPFKILKSSHHYLGRTLMIQMIQMIQMRQMMQMIQMIQMIRLK